MVKDLNDVKFVKQKLVENNPLESIVSILTLGFGGILFNKLNKRYAENKAKQKGCLCAFREDVFPLPYSNEVVHKWRLYDKDNSTGRYSINTGIVFSQTTGHLEKGKDEGLKYENSF